MLPRAGVLDAVITTGRAATRSWRWHGAAALAEPLTAQGVEPTHSNAAAWHSCDSQPLMVEADGPVEPAVRAKAGRLTAGEFLIEALPYRAAGRDGGAGSAHPVVEAERMIPSSGCGDAGPVIGKQAADFREGERAVVTGVAKAFEPVCLGSYHRVVVGDHVGDPDPARWPGDAEHLANHSSRIRDLMQRQPADHQIELLRGPGQRYRVADQERDVGQALRGGQALTLPQHLRRQIERTDIGDVGSKGAAEVGCACRDVKNQFFARRCQLRNDPFQTPGGEPLIGERNGLDMELFTHQVIMCTGHTDMVDSWKYSCPNWYWRLARRRETPRVPGTAARFGQRRPCGPVMGIPSFAANHD